MKGMIEATSTSAWEPILNAGKGDDASHNCQGVEEPHVKSVPASEDEDDSVSSVLQEEISDKIKFHVANPLATITDMGEEAFEQLSHAAILGA